MKEVLGIFIIALLSVLCNSYYVTTTGERVDDLLNNISFLEGFGYGWTENLDLANWPTVNCLGLLTGTWTGDFRKTLFEVVPELKNYTNSNEYAIGNRETNQIIKKDFRVTKNVYIEVMKKHSIDIEFDKPLSAVNLTEIADAVSTVTGIDSGIMIIEVVCNDDGDVIGIVLTLPDENLVSDVVDALNKLDKGDECVLGAICYTKKIGVSSMSLMSTPSLNKGLLFVHNPLVLIVSFALMMIIIV